MKSASNSSIKDSGGEAFMIDALLALFIRNQ
jgi:hypothetical protein